MRRLARVVGYLALALVLDWAPEIPPRPAEGQAMLQGDILPGSLQQVPVTVANTAVATVIYTTPVPQETFQQFTPTQLGATNLHLKAQGIVSTIGNPGTVTLTCSYGGATGQITLLNAALPGNLASAPLTLDVFVKAQSPFTTQSIVGLLTVVGPTPTTTAGRVIGTTSMLTAQTLSCTWTWATANSGNTVTIDQGSTVIGN